MKSLLVNPVIFILSAMVFIGFVGPWLISAPSTIAVIIGIFMAALYSVWGKHFFTFYLNKRTTETKEHE